MNDNSEEIKNRSILAKVLRVLFGVIFWVFSVVVLIVITLVLVLQIPSIRTKVIHTGINAVNSILIGKIEVEDIDFSNFPNLLVKNARLIAAGDTLVTANKIYVEPNLWEIIAGNIKVLNVFLESPKIKLLRSKDSTWNFSKIAKPTPPDSTPSANVHIDVGELLIDNASVDIIDTLSLMNKNFIVNKNMMNYDKMMLRDFSLKLSAQFDTKYLTGKVNIKHLQFYDVVSGFVLNNFNLDGTLHSNSFDLNKLYINTPKTDLTLSGKAEGISLGDSVSINEVRNMQLQLQIYPSNVYIRDVEYFANTTLKKELQVRLAGNLSGKLNELEINELLIKPDNSELNLTGKIYNILDGEFRYTGNIYKSNIHKDNLLNILPDEITKSLPDFSILNLEDIYFDGTGKKLDARINMLSDMGNINGSANLIFSPIFTYNSDIKFQNLNLAKATNNNSLHSNLSGNLKIRGRHTEFKKLNADLTLNLYNSKFQEYNVNTLNLQATMNAAKVDIRNLHITLPRDYYSDYIKNFYNQDPTIDINGMIDLADMKEPIYDLNVNTIGLNVAKLTKNPQSIEYLTTKLRLKGQGFDTKGFLMEGNAEISDLVYMDKSAMPFNLDVYVDTKNTLNKTIMINSDIVNLNMQGDFTVEALIEFGKHQSKFWANTIKNKTEKIKDPQHQYVGFTEKMLPAHFRLQCDIKDISLINLFLQDQKIFSNLRINLNADIKPESAHINVDTIDIFKFQYLAGDNKLDLSDIQMSAAMSIQSDTVKYFLDSLYINLPQKGLVTYNDMKFIEPLLQVKMNDNDFYYSIGVNKDNEVFLSTKGEVDFTENYLGLKADLFNVRYKDALKLANKDTLDIRYNDGNIHIEKFHIKDQYGSNISASGDLIDGAFKDMTIKISDMKLASLDSILQNFTRIDFGDFRGRIDSLTVLANGELKNPNYKFALNTSDITASNQRAGKIQFNLEYQDKNIFGKGEIIDTTRSHNYLDIDINSFPIDLSVGNPDKSPSNKPIDVSVKTDSLPISIISPFIPQVSDMRGFLNMNLAAKGKNLDNLDYSGSIDIPNFNFILLANNLRYFGSTKIDFNRQGIKISNLNLNNDINDYRNGSADISGQIKMDGFKLLGYEFTVNTGGFMVLGAASARAIPSIYGRLVIATGERPINVKGSLTNLDLTGDINFISGSLTMPKIISSNSVESKMVYKVLAKNKENETVYNVIDNSLGDTLYTEINNIKDSVQPKPKAYKKESGIADNMSINMNFRIINPLSLRIDLGTLGNLTALIGLENQYYPLSLNYTPYSGISLTGDIKLMPGSKLFYVRQFETEGTISFPLGTIANPTLNLYATYNGKSYVKESLREFKVFMHITGTKDAPNISFDYELNGESAKGDSTQVFQDALSLVFFNRTKTEMEMGMANLGNSTEFGSMGIGVVTKQFSQFLSDVLQGTGSVESVEIDMGVSNRWEDAKLRATGRIFDRFGWHYGGDMNDLSQNMEMSLEIPMNIILDSNYLNNIVWQFSFTNNAQQTAINRNQKDWEIKLRFGGNW